MSRPAWGVGCLASRRRGKTRASACAVVVTFLFLLAAATPTPAAAQGVVPPPVTRAASTDTVRWATVTYLAGRSVYISAGRDDGLREGAELDVVRRGTTAGRLRVTVLSSRRASCEIVAAGDSLAVTVGDSVRFVVGRTAGDPVARRLTEADSSVGGRRANVDSASDTASSAPRSFPGERRTLRALGLRGRVGVRYLVVAQSDSGALRFTQPAADIRIDGQRIAGSPIDVSIDARGRRTYQSRGDAATPQVDTRTHVYQLSASVHMNGGGRVTVGRQLTEAFANVSLYDGISAQIARQRWGTGLFAGTQPAAATMGFATDIKEFGAYVQAHGDASQTARWTTTLGAIGSYHASDPNREFVFTHLAITTSRASLYAVQEIDYNRGWKTAAGEPTLQPTSTFVSAQVRPSDALTVYAGFDSRRNVRLWRDLVSPETEFDDRFRRGVWGGVLVRAARHLRVSADLRASDAGDSSGTPATAASGVIAADGIGAMLLSAQLRSARFRSPWVAGWLHSGAASVAPWDGRLRLELEGGIRDQQDQPGVSVSSSAGRSHMHWVGVNADVALGRAWYFLFTATRETGGWDSAHHAYTSLSWRF